MSGLDDLPDDEALVGLLALASAAAGGAAIGVADPGGTVVAGRSPGAIPPRAHPLILDDRPAGAVVGAAEVQPELLALVARSVELILSGGRDLAERTRVSHELAIGRQIQRSLLPRFFPDVPGWAFAATYEPAREVGGDLFDVFRLRRQRDAVGLLIADVTGKGIPAALLMADVRALLHAAADNADGPADAFRRVNAILVGERLTSLFVTAALLVVDSRTGAVRYASAGHEAPLVARRDGGLDRLDVPGPILGAFGDADFSEQAVELGPGDALVLYTDGVTEARDARRRFYGEDRLVAMLARAGGEPAESIRRAIVDDVRSFRGDEAPFDDLTLLVAERLAGAGAT